MAAGWGWVVTAVVLSADSVIRHDLADDGPWVLCNLGVRDERRFTGALDDEVAVNCWACRTIRAGDDPDDPNAPAKPGGAR